MNERETVTPEMVKKLRQDYSDIQGAYRLAEDEARVLKSENELLRSMKDAEQVREMDHSNMSEWETFISAVSDAKEKLNKLDRLTTSILFHSYKGGTDFGFTGSDEDRYQLNVLESEGYIKWDDGWKPDYDHAHISRADNALTSLNNVMKTYGDIIEERFQEEFDGIRFGLNYSPFWEGVLGQKIDHSQQ
jgi:hypothetical protein